MAILPDIPANSSSDLGLSASDVASLEARADLEMRSALERGDLGALFTGFVNFSLPVDRVDPGVFGVKGQNVCLARRVAGVRFGLFECRLSGCSRCR